MSKLLYITNMSLDGYIEDATGRFDWGIDDAVHRYITELVRPIGTHLYGRRLYETMAYWDAAEIDAYPTERRDFARVWQNADKIVFSRTLTSAATRNTRLEREFDVDAIRTFKRQSKNDIFIGGAQLAAVAIEAGLVDECRLFVYPVIVGGGKPAFGTSSRRDLELLEMHRFGSGVVYLRFNCADTSMRR